MSYGSLHNRKAFMTQHGSNEEVLQSLPVLAIKMTWSNSSEGHAQFGVDAEGESCDLKLRALHPYAQTLSKLCSHSGHTSTIWKPDLARYVSVTIFTEGQGPDA